MMKIARSIPALALLTSSMLAAQQPVDRVRDAAFREAERFANCLSRGDAACVREFVDGERLAAAGLTARHAAVLGNFVLSLLPPGIVLLQVERPWPPFAIGDEIVVFVPTLKTVARPLLNAQVNIMAYLIATSADGGESWRFIVVNDLSALTEQEIDRIPGIAGRPRPEQLSVCIEEPALTQSRWLITRERGFVAADVGRYVYVLTFEIREDIEDRIDFTVSYDNPANPGAPSEFRGSLEPGQRGLPWQSPPLGAFEPGQRYQVLVEGRDSASGDLVFEHRESLVFHATRELWRSVMSKPPEERPQVLDATLGNPFPEYPCSAMM